MLSSDKKYTVEEYIQHEWRAELRSNFIDGFLYEIQGGRDIDNEIAGNLCFILIPVLKPKGYCIYSYDVKVKIFGENKYYYPDVFITKETKTESNKYIKAEPILIVEVVSESSQVNDYVDKYIDYTKNASLQYYLIVEPETTLITCYTRDENGEWVTTKYTKPDDEVKLEKLDISFRVSEVYS